MSAFAPLVTTAIRFTRNVALESIAIRWTNSALLRDELPDDLLKEKKLVLIYLLPKVLLNLEPKMRMASFFMTLWQYGKGDYGSIKTYSGKSGQFNYWKFNATDFSQSETLKVSINNALSKNLELLPKISSTDPTPDGRWDKLKSFASAARDKNKGKNEWSELTPNYREAIASPDILLEKIQINTATYIDNEENPLRSDAYAALGPCAVRVYLYAEIKKKPGDEKIYVVPKRIGARIWDDFNFNDAGWDWLSGLLAGGRASQFLGSWANSDTGATLILQNSDFIEFREIFMLKYNNFLNLKRSNKPQLRCLDFSSFSNYVEREITEIVEYPLNNI